MSRRAARYKPNKDTAASLETAFDTGKILGVFESCFTETLELQHLHSQIQTVKGHLYNRDYLAAFGLADNLRAYVVRWTPARALAYTSLFSSLKPVRALLQSQEPSVVCVGGGAASELVALCAIFCNYQLATSLLKVHIIDIANWTDIVQQVKGYIEDKWYGRIEAKTTIEDVLELNASVFDTDLITLMFTTNELFCEQKAKTVKFLNSLQSCKQGALLLITESAGSYSHVTVGQKKFPVQFLIDTILCGKPGENGAWEIIDQTDSTWYRIDQSKVSYPFKLENMRFFFRLYRRT